MPCRLDSCQQGRAACPNPHACHLQSEPWDRWATVDPDADAITFGACIVGVLFFAVIALGSLALLVHHFPEIAAWLDQIVAAIST